MGRLFFLTLPAGIRPSALVLGWLLLMLPGAWRQASGGEQIVVPNRHQDIPGSLSTDTPFAGHNTFLLQVYDASQFEPLRDGAFLTGVSFRTQEGDPGGFNATYDYFEVQLATFKQPISTLPSTYKPEEYGDATIVFAKNNVRLSGTVSTEPEVPSPFDIRLEFEKPFYFDPKAGNLLMYLRSGNLIELSHARVDIEDSLTPPVGYFALGTIGGPHFGAISAQLVSQFDFTAVPEPSPVWLGSWGVVFLIIVRAYAYRGRVGKTVLGLGSAARMRRRLR